jgi:Family of unknown function (DUF5681)
MAKTKRAVALLGCGGFSAPGGFNDNGSANFGGSFGPGGNPDSGFGSSGGGYGSSFGASGSYGSLDAPVGGPGAGMGDNTSADPGGDSIGSTGPGADQDHDGSSLGAALTVTAILGDYQARAAGEQESGLGTFGHEGSGRESWEGRERMTATAANDAGEPRRRFQPGQSGNPSGRPRGSRNRTTLALEALLDGEAEALTRIAVDMARRATWRRCACAWTASIPPAKTRP